MVAFAVLGLLLAWLALDAGRATIPAPPPPRPRDRPRARAAAALPAMPTRNVFEFVTPPPPAPRPAPAFVPPSLAPETPLPSAEPPVRLVGLVRRGGALRAALAVGGETLVVGVGERVGDYMVIGVEEDSVRLRAADGATITLTPVP